MPAWLINIIVSLAIKVGIPWVVQHIPGIPQAVIDIITQLLNDLNNPKVSNSAAKKMAVAQVKALREQASGVARSPETKGLD